MAQLVPVEEKRPKLVPVDEQGGGGQEKQEPLTPGQIASGVGQTALTMATGAVAEPISGFAGLLTGLGGSLIGGIRGDEDILDNMVEAVEGTRRFLTVEPFNESGRRVSQAVAEPLNKFFFEEVEERASEDLQRTGSPLVATGTKTGMEVLPMAFGFRGLKGVPRGRVREAERFAREEGISLRGRGESQQGQISAAATRRADTTRARSMDDLQKSIAKASEAAKNEIDALYEQARSTRAGIPVREARGFEPLARKALEDFDIADMPKVQSRLKELERIKSLPDNSSVKLSEIDKWRKRINKNRAASTDPSQNAALDILKGELDTFMDAKFNADMISGSPEALAKWKDARGAVRRYKENFSEEKAIAQMARKEATPEEIRQWVFGASSVGAKKEAGRVVSRLKKLVGEDSPEFTAMRSDALFDVMKPLMRESDNVKTDLKGFVRNFDRMVRENDTFANELYGPALKELKQLRDFAAASIKRGDPPKKVPLSRMAAVMAAGHGIARAALKVTLVQRLVEGMRAARNKELFLREVFDAPVSDPMLARFAKTGATVQAAGNLDQRTAEERQPLGGAAQ